MSAGTGITHSEFNNEYEETLLFQIWIEPQQSNLKPCWKNINIINNKNYGIWPLVSGEKKFTQLNLLKIHQNVTLYQIKGNSKQSIQFELDSKRQIYFVISIGSCTVQNIQLGLRDGAHVKDKKKINFIFQGETELILLDLPIINS